jgi:glutathione S-transferase
MKLYYHPASTTSRPVVLFAAEEGIALDLQLVDLMKGEHVQQPYLDLNPNGLVPMLDDDGFRLTESSAILKYLAEKTGSALYPKDLKARARVNEAMDWFNTNLYRELGYNLVYPQVYPHHKRPDDASNATTVKWGASKCCAALKVLDEHMLAGQDWLAGDAPTIADYFGACLLTSAELVKADLSPYPNVTAWLGRVKALPCWAKVNEVHDGFVQSLADKELAGLG